MKQVGGAGTTIPGVALSLERYAETLAAILHEQQEPPQAVVERLGIASAAWTIADRLWTEALTCPGRQVDSALAVKFASVLSRKRKQLAAGAKVKQEAPSPKPQNAPVGEARAESPPAAPRAAEVPSYLREERPTPGPDRMSPPPPQYAATMALPIMRPDEMAAPVMSAQPSPMFAPTPSEDEVNETAEVDVRCFRKPLPFADAQAKPSAEPVAIPPAGKRLIRFDPQTGEPLSSPRWADVPVVDGAGKLASFGPGSQYDEPTGHETAAIPALRPQPALPFPSSGAPSRDAENSWKPK